MKPSALKLHCGAEAWGRVRYLSSRNGTGTKGEIKKQGFLQPHQKTSYTRMVTVEYYTPGRVFVNKENTYPRNRMQQKKKEKKIFKTP